MMETGRMDEVDGVDAGKRLLRSGDVVRRKDGACISTLLPNGGMTCVVGIGQGEPIGALAWHFPGGEVCPKDKIGLSIGFFPTWDDADAYELVSDERKKGTDYEVV